MVNKSRIIYLSHFFSSWGDRMWFYAVAVFLMRLDSGSLLLSAIYGLVISGSVLMFGSPAGQWIDKMPRLQAAQITLIVQNSSVALFAIILLIYEVSESTSEAFLIIVKISAMILGITGQIASVALSIMIQKDWIVVIANGDQATLSTLNSVLRRINLITKLLAPLVCGQVITFGSFVIGCGFIAGWNILSMVVEYYLFRMVYLSTPALASKKTVSKKEKLLESRKGPAENDDEAEENSRPNTKDKDNVSQSGNTPIKSDTAASNGYSIFKCILVIPAGWNQYMSQSTVLVGIGLSFLYMTVLGVDIITNAFALSQCFSAALVGIIVGASAITGIISTFLFSPLTARFGVVKTGLLSSLAQVVTLVPCLASIFVAGSPFFAYTQNTLSYPMENTSISGTADYTSPHSNLSTSLPLLFTKTTYNATSSNPLLHCDEGIEPPSSYLSISLLSVGLVLGRVGLWGFDLAATQLFQENVPECERGVVGGVQSSMNSLMDLLHYVLVTAFPNPDQYGILIILSSAFVLVGHLLFLLYAVRVPPQ